MPKEFVSEEVLIMSQPIRYIKIGVEEIIDINLKSNKNVKDRVSLEKILFQSVYRYFGQCIGHVSTPYNPIFEKESCFNLSFV